MYWRVAVAGVVWLGALALFATGLQQSRSPRQAPPPSASSALVRTLNQPQADAGARWWSWRVTDAVSAHRMMTVEVEAERLAEAKGIAVQVVEPVRTHGYEEILIYVRRPGATLPERRVQWTPRRGYVEMNLTD